MTTAQEATLRQLEAAMSNAAGFTVELTIRAVGHFTASADGKKDFTRLSKWMQSTKQFSVTVEENYDAECDLSCLYFTAK